MVTEVEVDKAVVHEEAVAEVIICVVDIIVAVAFKNLVVVEEVSAIEVEAVAIRQIKRLNSKINFKI